MTALTVCLAAILSMNTLVWLNDSDEVKRADNATIIGNEAYTAFGKANWVSGNAYVPDPV